jgi:hypothetical protein
MGDQAMGDTRCIDQWIKGRDGNMMKCSRRLAVIELDDDGDETDGLRPNSDGDDDYRSSSLDARVPQSATRRLRPRDGRRELPRAVTAAIDWTVLAACPCRVRWPGK